MEVTQTYSKCPLFRGAGCCQQVRVSLVVAQTMVLLAFVSCCGASSRLVNFLTIKVFNFYFMFDLNFYFVYFFLFGLILGRGGHFGNFWVGMCRPGPQIGTPF